MEVNDDIQVKDNGRWHQVLAMEMVRSDWLLDRYIEKGDDSLLDAVWDMRGSEESGLSLNFLF